MKRTYVFERAQREEIVAYNEEEARWKLGELTAFPEEFELIDVWSAEGPNAARS